MSRWPSSSHSPAPSCVQSSAQVPGELVSALMDGQLRGPLLAQTAQAVTQDPEALTRWRDYHLIGEAMRAPVAQQTVVLSSPAFLARLKQRLSEEGVVQGKWPDRWVAIHEPFRSRAPQAAPQAFARRRWVSKAMTRCAALSAMASMALIAGASLMPDADLAQWVQPRPSSPQQLAVQALPPQPSLALGGLKEQPMPDRRLQEFLAAHQQAAGGSALSGAFFLNATFERKTDAPR